MKASLIHGILEDKSCIIMNKVAFSKTFFLEQFKVHSKIKGEMQRFPILPLEAHMNSLLHDQLPPPE